MPRGKNKPSDDSTNKYECDICKKLFRIPSKLNEHKRIHTGEKSFACEICDRKFRHKYTRKVHSRIHTGEKPFQCNICDKAFSQSGNLILHKRIHTGEKPYKCNICDQTFSRKCTLTQHKRIHTGEKPYKCYICNTNFAQRGHLRDHVLTHNGQKFECELCLKSYKTRSGLKFHQRAQHNLPKIKCTWNDCNKEFADGCVRMKHIREDHDPTPYHCDRCDRKYAFKRELMHHKRKHEIMKTRKLLQK